MLKSLLKRMIKTIRSKKQIGLVGKFYYQLSIFLFRKNCLMLELIQFMPLITIMLKQALSRLVIDCRTYLCWGV